MIQQNSFVCYLRVVCLLAGIVLGSVSAEAQDGAAGGKPSPLDLDKRLAYKVTLVTREITLSKCLGILSRQSRVPLTAEPAFEKEGVVVGLHGVALKDWMDAAATLTYCIWEKSGKGYHLKRTLDHIKDMARDNQPQRDLTKAGLEFADAAQHLPPAMLRLLGDEEDGYKVPFGKLPPKMQEALGRILDAEIERQNLEEPTREHLRPVTRENLSTTKLSLWKQPSESGYCQYTVGIGIDNIGSTMMSFSDFSRVKQQQEERERKVPTYNPEGYGQKRADSLKGDFLNKPITLSLRGANWEKTAFAVIERAPDVNFLAIAEPPVVSKTKNVFLTQMPLHKALDQLVKIYSFHHWQVRCSGIVVLAWGDDPEAGKKPEQRK